MISVKSAHLLSTRLPHPFPALFAGNAGGQPPLHFYKQWEK